MKTWDYHSLENTDIDLVYEHAMDTAVMLHEQMVEPTNKFGPAMAQIIALNSKKQLAMKFGPGDLYLNFYNLYQQIENELALAKIINIQPMDVSLFVESYKRLCAAQRVNERNRGADFLWLSGNDDEPKSTHLWLSASKVTTDEPIAIKSLEGEESTTEKLAKILSNLSAIVENIKKSKRSGLPKEDVVIHGAGCTK
jgi:hypothetical protein